MLKNEMYIGTRYFNTVRRIREYANPMYDIKHSTSKVVPRDRSDWVGVSVPAIVSQTLFDKAQERRAWNRSHYRNPRVVQLLSSLIRCGCGSSMFAYKRYYTDKRVKTPKVYQRISYKCNYKHRLVMHAHGTRLNIKKCTNKEIKSDILESRIFFMIQETMLSPYNLRECMDFFKRKAQANQLRMEKQLKLVDQNTLKLTVAKKRLVELYASEELEKDLYINKNLEYDNELNKLKSNRKELLAKIPLLHKKEIIDVSIKQYCESAKVKFAECSDFETRRNFLLDHVEKIVHMNDTIEIHGSVPVKLKAYDSPDQITELAKIEFCIKDKVTQYDRVNSN